MLDVRDTAASVGISLLCVRASLGELLRAVPGPKILHMHNPDHFLVLVRGSAQSCQILDGGMLYVLSPKQVETWYSGHALTLKRNKQVVGPRLRLTEFDYHFGIVGIGQQVVHRFKVENDGTADLTVALQSRGCSAPEASVSKETIAPGKSATITVRFRVEYTGEVVKSVKLLTNDLAQPVAFLTMHGTVPYDLVIVPDRVAIFAHSGQPFARRVSVSGPATMTLERVSTDSGDFAVNVEGPTLDRKGRRRWCLTLTLRNQNLRGRFSDRLLIRTNDPDRPLAAVPLSGLIVPDATLSPPSAFFGFVKLGSDARITLTVFSRSGRALRVTGVTSASKRLAVGEPRAEGSGWVVPVRVETTSLGTVDSYAILHTDLPGEGTIRVPVYAQVVR